MSEVSARGTAALTTYRFDFIGRTGEYFRIWVVSLFLSVVTLGIYSAWGKVRKKRYLYSHTELDGTGFEFRATPLAILRGRVIALVLLGGFALSGHVLPIMQLVFIIILLALTPWIVVAASRFNARNSAWRNITFSFNGGFWEAARVFLALGLLAVVTLGLMYPYARMRRARFIIEHHRFGDTQIGADLMAGGFILAYLLAALMFIGIMVLFVAAMVGLVFAAGAAARHQPSGMASLAPVAVLYVAYIAVYAFLRAQIGNLTLNGVVVGPLRCRSTLRVRDLVWLYLSNIVAILATLGLATAWVTIRMARYRARNLYLIGEATPEAFMGTATSASSATGSEVSDLFDVDVSL
ncbi:MAG TPA: YjgN family protein [Xanthomonadaceae bacterium]|nr:YjgN family protein [Xanthomonadaceae bacterium]